MHDSIKLCGVIAREGGQPVIRVINGTNAGAMLNASGYWVARFRGR
jgi:hypothetical protein